MLGIEWHCSCQSPREQYQVSRPRSAFLRPRGSRPSAPSARAVSTDAGSGKCERRENRLGELNINLRSFPPSHAATADGCVVKQELAAGASINVGSNPGPPARDGLKSLRICSFLARRNSLRIPRVIYPAYSSGVPETKFLERGFYGRRVSEAVFESSDVERFAWILMEV